MNYYERYVGDYQRDTAHLTLAEHGALTMLLDTLYATEKPLLADYEGLYRICRAFSKDERSAVRTVADQFFPINEDGFRHNAKADELILKARARIEIARKNGAKGGRPLKHETEFQPSGLNEANPADYELLTQRQTSPTPTPTPYKKRESSSSLDRYRDDDSASVEIEPHEPNAIVDCLPVVAMAGALRKFGVSVTEVDPALREWISKGVTIPVVLAAVEKARAYKPMPEKIHLAYLAPIVSEIIAPRSAKLAVLPESRRWWESTKGINEKGMELGIENTQEIYAYYRDQVFAAAGEGVWNQKNRGNTAAQGFKAFSHLLQKV